MRFTIGALCLLAACGDRWKPGTAPHTEKFPLVCAHAEATCESCHPADQPIGKVDPECLSCHLDDRPASHDPVETATCTECHLDDACGWNAASPHPEGFSEPEMHGLEAKFGGPTEGDCTTCHGADLRGGESAEGVSASGCDDCHAEEGHADWRVDCTFCHGGEQDLTGAPPKDIDGTSVDLSFPPHHAHAAGDPNYPTLGCADCHVAHNDAMSPGHWFDDTPGLAENTFAGGIASTTEFDGQTCTNNYCHSTGARDDGTIAVDAAAMTCDSCHPTAEGGWDEMSGLHQVHLLDDGITCNDCHAAVIDANGDIATPARHVDRVRNVNFVETSITTTNNGGTCNGECHGTAHDDSFGWGHVSDYEKPELHGLDTNLQLLDCGSCHGATWAGGIAQGCDGCHADEGHANWRTDCTFCHGGTNGDTDGLPPEDIDGETSLAKISFSAHPAHHGTGQIGHPEYDCSECHKVPTTALSVGHALDATDGKAEVTLTAGWSSEGAYDPSSGSCSNMWCHGDGQSPSGTITDGTTGLDCDSCHATTVGWTAMSGTHSAHLEDPTVTCVECHAPVVDALGTIDDRDLHVDRDVTVSLDAGWNGTTCTNNCHDVNHDGIPWSGAHPDGFDASEVHGQEALQRLQVCTDCHGDDLRGDLGSSCDDCHADEGHADWRTDCVFCHGGQSGDVDGAPPEDIDNETVNISFVAHRAHLDQDIHPQWDCTTCHDGTGDYTNAVTDSGHWLLDSTPKVAEVKFSGLAVGAVYAAGNCSNNYCHGNGQENGESLDGSVSLTCDGCHSTDFLWTEMSGTHATHLEFPGVVCADCHSTVVNATNVVTGANQHVDGTIDVSIPTLTETNTADGYTCTGTCHNQAHTDWNWAGGHPPGYDAPEEHGQDALFQVTECRDCHGYDANGGSSGQGCDSCHDAGWREDCTYCHGGEGGDVDGAPPSDLDGDTNEATISFMAHPEHLDGDEHPLWGCTTCHDSAAYSDAWDDAGHWWDDGSIGAAEVDMSGGLASASTYNSSTSTCSNNYCHGTGKANGSETDSATALACDDCHGDPPSSGDHNDHDNYDCSDCHPTAENGDIVSPTKHVNGVKDVADGSGTAITFTYNGSKWTCNGTCHDGHSNDTW